MISVSVVVPVHNEEETLNELYRRIACTLRGLNDIDRFEIIFVDDCSSDGSNDILREIRESDNCCIICEHQSNKGQSGALRTGFDHARYEVCVTIDADLQIQPEDIARLLAHIDRHDIVNGRRLKRQDRLITVLSSRAYNLLMRTFLNSPSRDSASNFTAFKTAYLKNLPLQKNDHRYLIPIVQSRGGTRFMEVEVPHNARSKGKSKYGLFKAWGGFFEFFAFRRDFRNGRYA